MNRFLTRMTLIIVALLQYSVTVFAGPLDDYYLQQFGETGNTQLQKAILSVSPEAEKSAQCGMPLKKSLRRDWDLLEQSTQKVLAKQLALPVISGTENTYNSSGGHFTIHYAVDGSDSPNLSLINQYTALSLSSTADWAKQVGDTFETAYSYYFGQRYQMPPSRPVLIDQHYHVYLKSLTSVGEYGETQNYTPDDFYHNKDYSPIFSGNSTYSTASYITIDKDFTNSIFHPTTYTPLQSLQITSAHEFHHAIQYGYNYFFDVWYAEATSTWMEDELYDGVNQLYNYIPAWFNNSITPLDLAVGTDAVSSGAGYGRWIFNRYLSEAHGPAMIRGAWEKLAPLPSPGSGADIPMIPVLESLLSSTTYGSSLGTDFFDFAKRVYQRGAWTDHSYDASKIHPYSPVAGYSTFPVNKTVTLPHYAFAYYDFTTPATGVTSLTVTINKTSGIQTALFKNSGEITAEPSGNSYVVSTFGSTDKVVLLIANTTGTDGHTASFSTDGTPGSVTDPPPTTPTTPTTTSSSSSGGGGGCFIATAAYGSYLHPQVQVLRNFRDEYLMTNAPGRAFVALYYRNSPPLADFIAHHPVLRGAARLVLTPLVVAVAHPLISAVSLFLFFGALLMPLRRRIKAARSNARPYGIRTT